MTSPARIARGHPEENLDMFRAVTNDCLSRALSSAVEHQYHTLGVAGSNPAARTNPASPDHFHGDFPRRFHPARRSRCPFRIKISDTSAHSPASESGLRDMHCEAGARSLRSHGRLSSTTIHSADDRCALLLLCVVENLTFRVRLKMVSVKRLFPVYF